MSNISGIVGAIPGPNIEDALSAVTNPPKTNADVQASGRTFQRQVDQLPPKPVLDEIGRKVDIARLEEVLMREGLAKFADPQKALVKLIASKRATVP